MAIGRMPQHSKEMGLDDQMNVDDTIVILSHFFQMGFAAGRHFRCLTFELMPQGPQGVAFRALLRTETKSCQPPHLSRA